MTTDISVNINSGNDLLPDDAKPLAEPLMTYHLRGPVALHPRAISQKVPTNLIHNICSEITS